MTRTPTTAAPVPTAPVLRGSVWFRLLVAAIVAATIGLVTWTAVQQRSIDGNVEAMPAPIQQSIRQVERADEARAALRHADAAEVRRFTNRVEPFAPVRPGAEDLERMEQAEIRRHRAQAPAPGVVRPGVSP